MFPLATFDDVYRINQLMLVKVTAMINATHRATTTTAAALSMLRLSSLTPLAVNLTVFAFYLRQDFVYTVNKQTFISRTDKYVHELTCHFSGDVTTCFNVKIVGALPDRRSGTY